MSGPVCPLSLGVTGHRQLEASAVAGLEHAVHQVLEGLREKAPCTPLLVLSSLAEGADRLFARIAIDRYGASLIAVLPMAAEAYAEDFVTAESKSEFEQLRAKASQVIVTAPAGFDAADPRQRPAAYACAGEWVALHGHVLVALWDGQDARGEGGTAEIVRAKLKGRYRHLGQSDLLGYDEGGAVVHVKAVRPAADPAPQARPAGAAEVKWLYPDVATVGVRGGAAHFSHVLHAIDRLNRLAASWRGGRKAGRLPHLEGLKDVASHFARAFQQRTQLAVQYMAFATVLGTASGFHDRTATLVSAAAIATGCLTWAVARLSGWQHAHSDFRALAEGCRLQLVWSASGIDACVADHYHPVQASSVQWIRRVLRTCWLLDRPGRDAALQADEPERRRAAIDWLDEQSDFFLGQRGVVPRYRRQARKFITLSAVCIGLGLLGLAGGELFRTGRFGDLGDAAEVVLVVAKVVLAAGASLHAYQLFMGFGDLQRSYALSAHLFKTAREEAKSAAAAEDGPRLRKLVFELGRAALVENVSWLLTRRQRHIPLPIEG